MIYFNLAYMFARIGLFSFGGGYAMLPLIFQSVQDFGVMSAHEFSNLVALSQVTPGPVAVNAATYVGFNYAGFWGAAAATFGVGLPSFVLVLIAVHFLNKFRESSGIEAVFSGIRPATVGLIASAAVFLAETALIDSESLAETALFSGGAGLLASLGSFLGGIFGSVQWMPACIFAITLVLAGKFKVSPIKITILMGLIGAFLC